MVYDIVNGSLPNGVSLVSGLQEGIYTVVATSMNGADGFTQTITNKDGSKDMTVYQRVKK